MDILDTLTGAEIFAASDRCEEAIDQAFMRHVERVRLALSLPVTYGEPDRREHINSDKELIAASWTYTMYDNNLIPLLIGSVVREHNHTLLAVIDRTGPTSVIHESKFDTLDFVAVIA